LLDPCLGLAQQFLAAALQRLAPLVDGHRLLERHLAFLEPLDDRFKFLDRALEGQLLDVGYRGVGHTMFLRLFRTLRGFYTLPHALSGPSRHRNWQGEPCRNRTPQAPVKAATWAATDSFNPCKS